mgnify:FL=1
MSNNFVLKSKPKKSLNNKMATIIIIVLAILVIGLDHLVSERLTLSLYGVLILAFILQKVIFSYFYNKRYFKKIKNVNEGDISLDVCVPFYNEDKALIIECIDSILSQKKIILKNLIIVDDGSTSRNLYNLLKKKYENNQVVTIISLPKNSGKRAALFESFKYIRSNFIALLDSDSSLDNHYTLSNIIRAFDSNTALVTAVAEANNERENFFTRVLNVRLKNAFLIERPAQAYFNSVLVGSGMLTVYRKAILENHKDELVNQTFFGVKQTFGDDRMLTGCALEHGKTIIAMDAVCKTRVASTLSEFISQQIRWNKSFFRESFLFISKFGVLKAAGFLSFMEVFFWIFYLNAVIQTVFFNFYVGFWTLFITYLAYIFSAGIFRNITIIYKNPQMILLYPLYSVIHIIVLTPIRLYSLLTLLNTKWGTR